MEANWGIWNFGPLARIRFQASAAVLVGRGRNRPVHHLASFVRLVEYPAHSAPQRVLG